MRFLKNLKDNGCLLYTSIDKAVGYALKNGLSLEYCILYTSGRTPFDMTMKIIMAGIPVVAAKAIPMMDSVELAKKYRLTMICAARPDRMLSLIHILILPGR